MLMPSIRTRLLFLLHAVEPHHSQHNYNYAIIMIIIITLLNIFIIYNYHFVCLFLILICSSDENTCLNHHIVSKNIFFSDKKIMESLNT